MFLVISTLLFLLILIISGCKLDTAEQVWRKPLTTLPNLKINSAVMPHITSKPESWNFSYCQKTFAAESSHINRRAG